MAGPFVAMGIATACCLVVSCVVGVIPGIIVGTAKAINHHKKMKGMSPVSALTNLPPSSPEKISSSALIDSLIDNILKMPADEQQAALEKLQQKFSQDFKGAGKASNKNEVSTALQHPIAVRKPLIERKQPRS